MEVNGLEVERRTVPDSGRVYAPKTWRGHTICVLVSRDGYTIDTAGAEAGVIVTVPEADYHRESEPAETGENPPQIRVGEDYRGETALLIDQGPRSS